MDLLSTTDQKKPKKNLTIYFNPNLIIHIQEIILHFIVKADKKDITQSKADGYI